MTKIAEESDLRKALVEDKEELTSEFQVLKTHVEEDADQEIEELKEKYDAKLTQEREATLRLKGENGLMRRKFKGLQRDIEEQKSTIEKKSKAEEAHYEKIRALDKDILGHRKEINEREETIEDKHKRIYDLKKKNQELEKFKCVSVWMLIIEECK